MEILIILTGYAFWMRFHSTHHHGTRIARAESGRRRAPSDIKVCRNKSLLIWHGDERIFKQK